MLDANAFSLIEDNQWVFRSRVADDRVELLTVGKLEGYALCGKLLSEVFLADGINTDDKNLASSCFHGQPYSAPSHSGPTPCLWVDVRNPDPSHGSLPAP
jgi:hypothetical protein